MIVNYCVLLLKILVVRPMIGDTYKGIVLKPGPMSRPGAGIGPGWKKNKGRKTRRDPVANPLTFFFLLKRCRFDLKKKNWPGRPGDLVKTRNLGIGPGRVLKLCIKILEIYNRMTCIKILGIHDKVTTPKDNWFILIQ